MSFKHLLKRQYGKKYYRMNIKANVEDRHADFLRHIERVPADTKVIQGHFRYADARMLYEANPMVPVITWLRNPVDRIISRYFFMQRKYRDGDQPEKTYMEHYSLLDYARDERFRNEMSRVLAGADLKDLAFVGILEFLEEDLAYLASLLNWGEYEISRRNTNVSYKSRYAPPSDAEREEIAQLNQSDIALYRYALELRNQRPALKAEAQGKSQS